MSSAQDKIILLAAVVVESVWIYGALAIFGLAVGLGGSPVSWLAAVGVMLASFFVSRTMLMIMMPLWMPYVLQMLLGVVVVYAIMGTQLQLGAQVLDLGWIGGLGAEDRPDDFVRRTGIAGLYAVLFWWRGGRLASTDFPAEHLSFVFRIGLLVLSAVAIVDIFNSADLKVFPLMFAFFAAGITGLSIGHILPSSGRSLTQTRWTRVIGLLVGGVTAVGLVLSLLQGGVLTFISTPIAWVLKGIATVVIYVVLTPILYVLGYIAAFLYDLIRGLLGEPKEPISERGFGAGSMIDDLREQAAQGEPSILLEVLLWIFIASLVIGLLWFLAMAFRRRTRWRRVEQDGDRESLEDVDVAVDLARLLFGLLPDRFRRRREDRRLRLPEDEASIVDVFRIYFGMLRVAESKGASRQAVQTPDEYQLTLANFFPERLVRMATAAFNRACYGRLPTSPESIAEMRAELERASNRG